MQVIINIYQFHTQRIIRKSISYCLITRTFIIRIFMICLASFHFILTSFYFYLSEPPQEVVLPPRIAQITSFVSFQKKKRLAAIREQPPILASNEVIAPVQPQTQTQPRIIPVTVPVTVTVPLAVSSPAESV